MFGFTVAGVPGALDDVFPGFAASDRLGVVVRSDFGAVGASTLILAAVTAFYDAQRARGVEFFVYPDYFAFHIGRAHGEHAMLEIFPSDREVMVEDSPSAVMRAISDRGITRLLVSDMASAVTALTLAGMRTVLAYDPSGRVPGADVTVTGNDITERYVNAVLDPTSHAAVMRERNPVVAERILRSSFDVDLATGARMRAHRVALQRDGRPVETFRRLTLDEKGCAH